MMKKDTGRALLGKWDGLLFAGLIAIAFITHVFYTLPGRGADNAFARISADREVIQTIDLSEDGEFGLHHNPGIRFSVQDGAIAFIESDCPDKTCVRSGYLRHSGQMAACVPNRISLSVVGVGSMDDLDAIAN